jgi:polyisoprenoid-binding protein YceI
MRVLMIAALIALPLSAAAASFRLDTRSSRIDFTYLENAAPKVGTFAALAGSAEFDPGDPSGADMRLTIQSRGIDLGDPLRSYFAQSQDWFWAERYPDFTVSLARLEPIGRGRYRAETTVLIKAREVMLPCEVMLEEMPDGRLRAVGEVRLNRHDYGLGVGFSALFATIGEDVVVRFELVGVPNG